MVQREDFTQSNRYYRVKRGFEIGSDHLLVRTKLKIETENSSKEQEQRPDMVKIKAYNLTEKDTQKKLETGLWKKSKKEGKQ